jgi:hypothetical protein
MLTYILNKRGESPMGQVTIYIDEDTERKMLKMIQKRGVSKSKWIAELIREKASTTWPENVVKLAGAWKDLPTAEQIRRGMGKDARRESV